MDGKEVGRSSGPITAKVVEVVALGTRWCHPGCASAGGPCPSQHSGEWRGCVSCQCRWHSPAAQITSRGVRLVLALKQACLRESLPGGLRSKTWCGKILAWSSAPPHCQNLPKARSAEETNGQAAGSTRSRVVREAPGLGQVKKKAKKHKPSEHAAPAGAGRSAPHRRSWNENGVRRSAAPLRATVTRKDQPVPVQLPLGMAPAPLTSRVSPHRAVASPREWCGPGPARKFLPSESPPARPAVALCTSPFSFPATQAGPSATARKEDPSRGPGTLGWVEPTVCQPSSRARQA